MITGKQFACTVQILAIHVLSIFILDAAGFSFTSFMKSKHKSKYTQQNINKLKCAPKKKYIFLALVTRQSFAQSVFRDLNIGLDYNRFKVDFKMSGNQGNKVLKLHRIKAIAIKTPTVYMQIYNCVNICVSSPPKI